MDSYSNNNMHEVLLEKYLCLFLMKMYKNPRKVNCFYEHTPNTLKGIPSSLYCYYDTNTWSNYHMTTNLSPKNVLHRRVMP